MAASDPTGGPAGDRIARRTPYLFLRRGAWRSLVARLLWEQEVAGSNPAAPMTTSHDYVVAALPADDAAVVVLIVAARLLVPLLIPRFPLVIVAAFLLDAVDNGLLGGLTGVDLSADGPYQSWDKALDIYYLSIAYLSTMRNWTSLPAFRVGRFLFYYRLAGYVLF